MSTHLKNILIKQIKVQGDKGTYGQTGCYQRKVVDLLWIGQYSCNLHWLSNLVNSFPHWAASYSDDFGFETWPRN
jgi:hypothetical protein